MSQQVAFFTANLIVWSNVVSVNTLNPETRWWSGRAAPGPLVPELRRSLFTKNNLLETRAAVYSLLQFLNDLFDPPFLPAGGRARMHPLFIIGILYWA